MAATSVGPNYILDKTWLVATGNTITGYQVVRGAAAGTCEIATDDSEPYLGVAQLDPNSDTTYTAGEAVRVRMLGLSKVQVAAAVAVYTRLSVIGLGLVDDANPGTAADYFLGISMEAGGQVFDIITVDLTSKNTQYFTS